MPRRTLVEQAIARPRRMAALAGRRGGAAGGAPLLATLDPNDGLSTYLPNVDGSPRHNAAVKTWSGFTAGDEPAADFDGSSQRLARTGETAFSGLLGTTYTVLAWIRPDTVSPASVMAVVGYRDANAMTSIGIQLNVSTGGKFDAAVRDDAGNLAQATGATTLTPGAWQLVGLTRSGTTVKAWLNGAEDGTATNASLSSDISDSDVLSVGARSDGASGWANYFDGRIGPVMVWNRVLSGAEILAISNGGVALQRADLTAAQANGLILWIAPGLASGANDLATGTYPLTATGSPTAVAGPGLTLGGSSPPSYNDTYRSVHTTGPQRGFACTTGARISGRTSWAIDGQIRGRIGHAASDQVAFDCRVGDGSTAGKRVVVRADGRFGVERLDDDGSVAASADSTITIYPRATITAATATALDSNSKTRLVFTVSASDLAHFIKGDVVVITGASSLSGKTAAIAEVDPAASQIKVVYDEGSLTAPTSEEITSGVRVVNQGLSELFADGSAFKTTERLPIRFGVQQDGDNFTFTFRDRTETINAPDIGAGPSGTTLHLGAVAGSELNTLNAKWHHLKVYGSALSAAQDAALQDAHGFVTSRLRSTGGVGVFVAGLEHPGLSRLEAWYCRWNWRLRDTDGNIREEHAYPDPTDINASLAGHPSKRHNPVANPTGPFFFRWFGSENPSASEVTHVDCTVTGPEYDPATLEVVDTPEILIDARAATVTIDPIPDTWYTASYSNASMFTSANINALRPCTVVDLAADIDAGNVMSGYSLNLSGLTGPIYFRGAGTDGPRLGYPSRVDSCTDLRFSNIRFDSDGSAAILYVNSAVDGLSGYKVRLGDPDNRQDVSGLFSNAYATNRLICLTRYTCRTGNAYGIFLGGGQSFVGLSGGVLDPLTTGTVIDPEADNTHTIRVMYGNLIEFSGRVRLTSLDSTSRNGVGFRHSQRGVVWTDDDGIDGTVDREEAYCHAAAKAVDRPFLVERVEQRKIVLTGSWGTVRQSIATAQTLDASPGSSSEWRLGSGPIGLGNRAITGANGADFAAYPETGAYANQEAASLAGFGTLTACEVRARVSGGGVILETVGYPQGGARVPMLRWERAADDQGTGAVEIPGGLACSMAKLDAPSSALPYYRVVAVEIGSDNTPTGTEAASDWVLAT